MSRPAITIGIKTHAQEPYKVLTTLASIQAQGIAHLDLIVVGAIAPLQPFASLFANLRLIDCEDLASCGKLGAMMNRIVAAAHHELCLLLDDDMVLPGGFWSEVARAWPQLQREHPQVHAAGFPLRNPDGTRFWDWAYQDDQGIGRLLPYDASSGAEYVTGGAILLRREVGRNLPWSSEKGFYQGEDTEWAARYRQQGYKIGFLRHAYILHNDGRYFQNGDRVHRRTPGQIPQDFPHWYDWLEHACGHSAEASSILAQRLLCGDYAVVPQRVDTLQRSGEAEFCVEAGQKIAVFYGFDSPDKVWSDALRACGFRIQVRRLEAELFQDTWHTADPHSVVVAFCPPGEQRITAIQQGLCIFELMIHNKYVPPGVGVGAIWGKITGSIGVLTPEFWIAPRGSMAWKSVYSWQLPATGRRPNVASLYRLGRQLLAWLSRGRLRPAHLLESLLQRPYYPHQRRLGARLSVSTVKRD